MKHNPQIRPATLDDVPAICRIARQNALSLRQSSLSKAELEQKGFLVSDYTRQDYANLIVRYPQSFALLAVGEVVAFLLGQDYTDLDFSYVVNRAMLKHTSEPFSVIKQVFVAPGQTGKGYGRMLYEHFIRQVQQDVYAAVVYDPTLENKGSAAFHEKLGFSKALEVVAEDDLKRHIYRYQYGIK